MNKPVLMFHEVLTDKTQKSGFNLESKGKYTITFEQFVQFVDKFQDAVIYSFDDGGVSNIHVADYLRSKRIRGVFCVPTSFIGSDGFLTSNELTYISKFHVVIPHGHYHIMEKRGYDEIYLEWSQALMKLNRILNFDGVSMVCLPGGTFSRVHSRVLTDLNVKTILHSAPSNFIMNFLYGKKFHFVPRRIIISNSNKKRDFINGIKAYLKQLIQF